MTVKTAETNGTATELAINLDDLTIDDLCELEDLAGEDAVAAMLAGKPGPKVLRGLVLLSMRKTNPDATIADAGRITLSSLPSPATPPA